MDRPTHSIRGNFRLLILRRSWRNTRPPGNDSSRSPSVINRLEWKQGGIIAVSSPVRTRAGILRSRVGPFLFSVGIGIVLVRCCIATWVSARETQSTDAVSPLIASRIHQIGVDCISCLRNECVRPFDTFQADWKRQIDPAEGGNFSGTLRWGWSCRAAKCRQKTRPGVGGVEQLGGDEATWLVKGKKRSWFFDCYFSDVIKATGRLTRWLKRPIRCDFD